MLDKRLSLRLFDSHRRQKGQGLVETALFFPVLLIVLSGLIEFGFLLNEYLALQDATRNAARFASDGLYYAQDTDHNCGTTRDFYRQISCIVNQELAQERPEITLNVGNGKDDIVVSALSVLGGTGVSDRHPATYADAGWSEALDTPGWANRNQSSSLTSSEINAKLNGLAPSTGFVLVEVFFEYEQKLKLPWITAFVDDPLLLHSYTIMPLVSAEPTSTPMP